MVGVDDTFHQGQPEPRPDNVTGAGVFYPIKSIEDVRQILLGNSHAGIGNPDTDIIVFHGCGYRNVSVFRRVADRVADQVGNHFFQIEAIGQKRGQCRQAFQCQTDRFVFGTRLVKSHLVGKQFPDLDIEPFSIAGDFGYCTKCNAVSSDRMCAHQDQYISFSGTEIRAAITNGQPLAEQVMRPEVLAKIMEFESVFVD